MGWPTVNLGDVCDLQNGFAFKSKSFKEGGTPVLRISSIQGEEVSDNRPVYVDENDYSENLSKYYVNQGDLLIAMSGGTTGKIGFLKTGARYLLNQRVGLFRPTKKLDKQYLFYFLLTKSEESLKISAGSAQPNLSTKQIKDFQIPLPPVEEQKRIVAILDEAFAGIDTAIANTEKNLANARELFESYLNSVFTQRGEGWVDKTLKQVCVDFGRGKSKHRPRNDPKLYGGPYRFIQTGDVRNCKHLIKNSTQTYNEAGLAQSKLWPKGTICITIAANIAETGILDFDACFPDSIIGMVVDSKQTSNNYVEYLLQSVKARIKAKGKGSAQDNINLATFENELFPFPSLNEQSKVVANLYELFTSIQRLQVIYQQKLASLSELKQSLLQKAFSGELTSKPDKLIDEAVT